MSDPKPFFRADHVGSLLRPPEVRSARERFARGEIDATDLRAVEDAAISDAVANQADAGLHIVTDGEFRRENWWLDYIGSLAGVEIDAGVPNPAFSPSGDSPVAYIPKTVRVTGTIGRGEPILVRDYEFLDGVSDGLAKVTIPSPSRITIHGGSRVVSRDAYADLEAFYADVARVYRQEIAALEAAGCRYIQIDDPIFSYFIDDKMRNDLVEHGDDPEQLLRRYVALVNACISERRPDTAVGLHVCRGNARSAWMASGGYDRIAETVLGGLAVDHLLLEFDDERSGGFEPLRHVPRGTRVVLGLVTTKRGTMEEPDVLRRRVDEATKYVPLEHLALSPQCGFASIVEGNIISPENQWAKLRLVVDTARRIWGG